MHALKWHPPLNLSCGAALGEFDDLAAFLAAPSPNRYHAEHYAQPVLLTSVASGGKSLVQWMLLHKLAELGKAEGWVGTVPLMPILVEMRKLVTGLDLIAPGPHTSSLVTGLDLT